MCQLFLSYHFLTSTTIFNILFPLKNSQPDHIKYLKSSAPNQNKKTRLGSIESQPKKVVVVVVFVVVVFVVAIIVDNKNLTLKFGQNWVNNKLYIVVVVFIVLVLLLWLIQKHSFKTRSDSGH